MNYGTSGQNNGKSILSYVLWVLTISNASRDKYNDEIMFWFVKLKSSYDDKNVTKREEKLASGESRAKKLYSLYSPVGGGQMEMTT